MRGSRAPLAPLALGLLAVAGWLVPGVAGQALLYPLLGVFPGMAIAALLAGARQPRWTLGLAFAPLASAAGGALLLLAGLPLAPTALGLAAAGWLLWTALEAARATRTGAPPPGPGGEPRADLRFLVLFAVGIALLTSVPWLLNPWLRSRSDAWIHGGIVWDIVRHGIPPEDPRFVGLRLNYVWFFNLFIALATGLTGRDPFVFMMLFNAVNLGVCIALVYRLALELWRERWAAAGAAILVPVGLGAGNWLLWSLPVLKKLLGSPHGWADAASQVRALRWGTCDVLASLGAPFAYMVNTLDKFTVGTALSYAWLMMLAYLWAMVSWLARGSRRALVWAGAGAAGMLFFHGVVGLSVIPVALGALAVAWLASFRWPWLPRGRLLGLAGATAAGALLAAPYTLAISRGWSAEETAVPNQYVHFGLKMAWTMAASLAVVAALAGRGLLRVARERNPGGAALALFTLGMALFALIVHLPLDNETKFVFEVFFPLAIFAGPALPPFAAATVRRLGAPLGAAALALLFLVPPVVMLASYALDPSGRTDPAVAPAPGEDALYAWIRAHVPDDGYLVDRGGRDLVMVKAQRRLWVGTTSGPERAAFPARELARRRAVEADLYGSADSLEADARALAGLGRPAYVLYRLSDFREAKPWRALEARYQRFMTVYTTREFRLYRVRSER